MPRKDMLTDTATDSLPSEFAEKIPLADTAGVWNRYGRRPAKRNRKWEKSHRPYRYVNVPLEVREQVLALAGHLNVTADEVARACLEYGLECVDVEKVQLPARPNPQGRKMTLFPRDQAKRWKEANGPRQEIPARRRSNPKREKKIHAAVSYRLPKRLHDDLCGLAMELDVPVGEVVAVLLQNGLSAYQRGELHFDPAPLSVKMTLFGSRS